MQTKRPHLTLLVLLLLAAFFTCQSKEQDRISRSDETRQRRQMVQNQIISRGVSHPEVVAAMLKVARHRFIPAHYRHFAYSDHPVPIGEGQTISQPYIVALMTQLTEPDSNDRVLEIGTGSGYQAAVLAEIVDSVYTIEIFASLAAKARKTLAELGYRNIRFKVGDGYQGWSEYAPFDAIIVTCAPSHIPEAFQEQLKEDGRLIIPVGKNYQYLVQYTKRDGRLVPLNRLPVRFVPMIDSSGTRY